MTNLKDFGMGKNASEEKILEECQRLDEVFKAKEGNQIMVHTFFLSFGEVFNTNTPVNYAALTTITVSMAT